MDYRILAYFSHPKWCRFFSFDAIKYHQDSLVLIMLIQFTSVSDYVFANIQAMQPCLSTIAMLPFCLCVMLLSRVTCKLLRTGFIIFHFEEVRSSAEFPSAVAYFYFLPNKSSMTPQNSPEKLGLVSGRIC